MHCFLKTGALLLLVAAALVQLGCASANDNTDLPLDSSARTSTTASESHGWGPQ